MELVGDVRGPLTLRRVVSNEGQKMLDVPRHMRARLIEDADETRIRGQHVAAERRLEIGRQCPELQRRDGDVLRMRFASFRLTEREDREQRRDEEHADQGCDARGEETDSLDE